MHMISKSGTAIAAAAATLLLSGAVLTSATPATAGDGIKAENNGCGGKNGCSGEKKKKKRDTNACGGPNGCGGKK